MKPLLLLDVDGVVNRFGFEARVDDCDTFIAQGYTVRVPHTARAHVAQLQEHFEMHWCTAWEDHAHRAFATALGLDPDQVWPHIKFDRSPMSRISGADGLGLSWKLPSIKEYVGDRPFVWIDDDITHDARLFVACRNWNIPSKIVRTDPTVGLDSEAVLEAVTWAVDLPAALAERRAA